jgi:hypothetical protein
VVTVVEAMVVVAGSGAGGVSGVDNVVEDVVGLTLVDTTICVSIHTSFSLNI